MDTGRPAAAVDVKAAIDNIRANMPETYRAIQAKAGEVGQDAYALVRRAIRGEANCFYAIERGHVVGKPFDIRGVMPELAAQIVQFGCTHLCMWAVQTVKDPG